MPAIIGPVEILNVTGGVAQFGDSLFISPKESLKTFAGSGAFNTGGIVVSNTGLSGTNITDTNLVDQPTVGNR